MDKDRVVIFDTTLRDGEQSPGCSMNLEEKLRIAEALAAMGVDVIEAGFPIASEGDFEAVNEIAKSVKGPAICGLSRATKGDIDRAAEALKPAERKRIHTFISTSPLHMKFKLQMDPEDVHQAVIDSVSHARSHTDDVEWSPEDGSRTEHDFLCRCVESAIDAGAGTINIPDTVGYAVPDEFGALIDMLMNRVPNIDKAIISVHCHNDLGLAVANSLAAVKAGARQVECTINGIGERAGNASMEEIVMALRTRADVMPYTTNIVTEHIMKASRLLSSITGFQVQPNKAIVGANAFAHESGIHQDGVLKNAATYEIMTPESVGLTKSNIVLGKHSGRHAFKEKARDLGYDLGDNALQSAFKRFKDLADLKKEVFDEDIIALIDDQGSGVEEALSLVSLEVNCGTVHTPPKAAMTMRILGDEKSCDATGDGPVDAAFNCIKTLFPHNARLQLYQVHAVTEGTDAQAEVSVRLEEDGRTVNGMAADTDTLVASCRAYIMALNKLLVKRQKTAPEALSA
ncbi:MAG: 2-isopropylmalate synthase [Rhodospirillales bacterium]|nr:2-isopropylmalate synthase [Rhodospirillales bacterium]